MKTITIEGDNWPVILNFGAMRRTLPIFGYSKVSEFKEMSERLGEMDFPADDVGAILRNMVLAGLELSKDDDRECPPVEYFTSATDADMTLFTEALSDGEVVEESAPGKRKRKTTKP